MVRQGFFEWGVALPDPRFDTHKRVQPNDLVGYRGPRAAPRPRPCGPPGYRSPLIYEAGVSRTGRHAHAWRVAHRRPALGRSRRPAGRRWTTRSVTSNGGNRPIRNPPAYPATRTR